MDPDTSRQVDERLEDLYRRHLHVEQGAVTSYCRSGEGYCGPDRADGQEYVFGVCLVSVDGEVHGVGRYQLAAALQSISKIITYGMALEDYGPEQVLERVGVEPSGDSFSSLEFDERNNRPYNPMVNSGALVTTDMVRASSSEDKLERMLQVLRCYTGNRSLSVNDQTFEAELRTADRNRATAYLMRSNGMLTGDVEEILALYLRQCSAEVTCRDLAVMAATLANGGINPVTGDRALPTRRIRDVLSVMLTCGMYDFAGEWAYSVGLPAKSGVSGGIVAVVPGKMGIGVFSPGLDPYGNSIRGTRVCQEISERLGLHIFATEAEDSLLGRAPPRD